MNTLLNFTMENGVSIGGIILVSMIISYVLNKFSVKAESNKSSSKSSSKGNGSSAAKGEEK